METIAPGLAKRLENSRIRRDFILASAAHLIEENGIESLTLNKLAERSGVTVPTIQNLIGKKAEVLDVLVVETMERVTTVVSQLDLSEPVKFVLTLSDSLIGLLQSDEKLFKAAFMAGERTGFFEHKSESGIYKRSLNVAEIVCAQARKTGKLEGCLDIEQLAKSLFAVQRLARQDWMNGYSSLEEYRYQLKNGMLLVLCSDATASFKTELISEIKNLQTNQSNAAS